MVTPYRDSLTCEAKKETIGRITMKYPDIFDNFREISDEPAWAALNLLQVVEKYPL